MTLNMTIKVEQMRIETFIFNLRKYEAMARDDATRIANNLHFKSAYELSLLSELPCKYV